MCMRASFTSFRQVSLEAKHRISKSALYVRFLGERLDDRVADAREKARRGGDDVASHLASLTAEAGFRGRAELQKELQVVPSCFFS